MSSKEFCQVRGGVEGKLERMIVTRIDLVAITETWLTSNDDFLRAQLCPNGYRFFNKPCKDGRGGGTAILFNDSLKVSFSQSGHTESLEYSERVVSSGIDSLTHRTTWYP